MSKRIATLSALSLVAWMAIGVSVAQAEVFQIACKWSGPAGARTVPMDFLIDTSASTVTLLGWEYNGVPTTVGPAQSAQITQGSIDWGDSHLDRFSGVLRRDTPNTDTMDCTKVPVQPLPAQKF